MTYREPFAITMRAVEGSGVLDIIEACQYNIAP